MIDFIFWITSQMTQFRGDGQLSSREGGLQPPPTVSIRKLEFQVTQLMALAIQHKIPGSICISIYSLHEIMYQYQSCPADACEHMGLPQCVRPKHSARDLETETETAHVIDAHPQEWMSRQ